jgi:cell division protein FtsW (lipid II flippase)
MSLRTNLSWLALALALFGNVMVYSATAKDYGTHYLVVAPRTWPSGWSRS